MLSGKGSTKSIKPSESRHLAKIVSEMINKKVIRDKKDLIAVFEYLIIVMSCLHVWLLKWCKNVILHNIYSINPFVYAIKTFMHSIIQHVDAIIAFVDSILQHVYAIKAFMHLIIQYGWEIVLPLCSFTQTDYVIKLSISTKQ